MPHFSTSACTWSVFAATNTTAVLASIKAAFTAATGWTATSITGGWRFKYTSDQALVVYVDCFAESGRYWGNPCIRVQVSGVGCVGMVHGLDVPSPTGQLQIVVNGGGFFISNPGLATAAGYGRQGTSCCGGLLHITKTGADDMPTEAWWSSGDGSGNPFFVAECPRLNLFTNYWPNVTETSEGAWNGTIIGGCRTPGVMRIVPKNAATEEMTSLIQWCDGTPLLYDAIVAWGATGTDPSDYPIVRGSIPDARISSLSAAMDATLTDGDGDWVNYTSNYIKGGLWLRVNATPSSTTVRQSSMPQYRKPMFLGMPPK